ncbi:MAG: hypothetical protein RL385_24 [Pseudomonadota bacterium]|jgi:hypothetical protein
MPVRALLLAGFVCASVFVCASHVEAQEWPKLAEFLGIDGDRSVIGVSKAGPVQGIFEALRDAARAWMVSGQGYARMAFAVLAPLQILWVTLGMMESGSFDLSSGAPKYGVEVGKLCIFYYLIGAGPALAQSIVSYFDTAGLAMTKQALPTQAMVDCILEVAAQMGASARENGVLEILDSGWVLCSAMCMTIFVSLIGGVMFVEELCAQMALGVGAILLGAGGCIWTRFLVGNYFRFAGSAAFALYWMRFVQNVVIRQIVAWSYEALPGSQKIAATAQALDITLSADALAAKPLINVELSMTLLATLLVDLVLVVVTPVLAAALFAGQWNSASKAVVGAASSAASTLVQFGQVMSAFSAGAGASMGPSASMGGAEGLTGGGGQGGPRPPPPPPGNGAGGGAGGGVAGALGGVAGGLSGLSGGSFARTAGGASPSSAGVGAALGLGGALAVGGIGAAAAFALSQRGASGAATAGGKGSAEPGNAARPAGASREANVSGAGAGGAAHGAVAGTGAALRGGPTGVGAEQALGKDGAVPGVPEGGAPDSVGVSGAPASASSGASGAPSAGLDASSGGAAIHAWSGSAAGAYAGSSISAMASASPGGDRASVGERSEVSAPRPPDASRDGGPSGGGALVGGGSPSPSSARSVGGVGAPSPAGGHAPAGVSRASSSQAGVRGEAPISAQVGFGGGVSPAQAPESAAAGVAIHAVDSTSGPGPVQGEGSEHGEAGATAFATQGGGGATSGGATLVVERLETVEDGVEHGA